LPQQILEDHNNRHFGYFPLVLSSRKKISIEVSVKVSSSHEQQTDSVDLEISKGLIKRIKPFEFPPKKQPTAPGSLKIYKTLQDSGSVDFGYPARPENAFQHFCKERRVEILKKNPNLSLDTVRMILEEEWGSEDLDKSRWNQMATLDSRRYSEDLERSQKRAKDRSHSALEKKSKEVPTLSDYTESESDTLEMIR